MEKITIAPKDVRCLGNIVSPKTVEDFTGKYSKITSSTDTIEDRNMIVYSTEYLPNSTLTVTGEHFVTAEDTVSFTAKLKDNNNSNISNATVYCNINNILYSEVTDNNGEATFEFEDLPLGEYDIRVYYPGDSNVASSSYIFNVIVGDEEDLDLDLISIKEFIQTDENTELISTLKYGDLGIQGETIHFYEIL